MAEIVQNVVMGAVRFLDGTTGLKVQSALRVEAPGSLFRPNRSGLYVIWSAPAGSLTATVTDPSGTYLGRQFSLKLPRDANPANAGNVDSIFRPADVFLFPSSVAPVNPGWAVLRTRVTKSGTDDPLASALIRVLRTSDSNLLARGMSDSRGEAMVAVPGVPVTTFETGGGGGGAVTANEIDVQIQTIFDPAVTGLPDPDDLEARRNTLPSSTLGNKLASGRTLVIELAVTIP
jgi:hypothetical protein